MDAKPLVFEIAMQSFQSDVVERSREVPVVVLFWTDQVPPAAEMKTLLEGLVPQYGGKVAVALSDVARDQVLAQQLRVQGIPSLRVVVDGALADQLDGPQDEATVREMLDRLTMTSGDMLKDQLDHFLEVGDWDSALGVLQRAIDEEPNNPAFKVEWADLLVRKGDLDGARTVLGTVPEDAPERVRPETRLELVEEAAAMGGLDAALADLEAAEDNLELRYQAVVLLAAAGRYEEALENAMFILQNDREFRDDIGRATMVRIFNVLGTGSDLATSFRRRMFNYMH